MYHNKGGEGRTEGAKRGSEGSDPGRRVVTPLHTERGDESRER